MYLVVDLNDRYCEIGLLGQADCLATVVLVLAKIDLSLGFVLALWQDHDSLVVAKQKPRLTVYDLSKN